MINNLRVIWPLTRALTRRYFRDKVAIFFTFLFPLIFLVVFGLIFGRDSVPSFDVALIKKSRTEFANSFIEQSQKNKVFKFTEVSDFTKAREQLGRGEFDAIIELPENFGELNQNNHPSGALLAYYDQSDQQLSATFVTVLQGVLDSINAQFIKVETPPLTLEAKPIQTANLSSFDYTLAGLIGFSILSLGIFSMSEGFTGDKKAGALRRLQVAPIKAWQLIVATALNRILVGIMCVALLFVAAIIIFDFNMRGDYLSFILFTILCITCVFGFGMAIAGWARDANQAAPLSNLVSFPMMFLSGVFFPRFLMPEFLQSLTTFVPLTPVVDGLRLILTEGKTLLDIGPQLAVLGGWTLIIYLIAFRVFRWE